MQGRQPPRATDACSGLAGLHWLLRYESGTCTPFGNALLMRAVVQRVRRAAVEVDGETIGAIGAGLLAFVGAGKDDTDADVAYVTHKIAGLRVFVDDAGKMNRSLADTGGELLIVSQFTLFGDVRRGFRPGFDAAMDPGPAEVLYEKLVAAARARGLGVQTGRFRADMLVTIENDGPVTILIDSKKLF